MQTAGAVDASCNPWVILHVTSILTMENVPVIDLEAERSIAVATLDAALRKYGFFYVTNHGLPSDLIASQFRVAADLFALPLEEKRSMPFDPDLDIGYVGSGSQSLNPDGSVQTTGDTKEQFMMTNNVLLTTKKTETIDPENVFEASQNYKPAVKDHAEVTRAYASAAYKLNLRLNDLLFDALELEKQDSVVDSDTSSSDTNNTASTSLRSTLGAQPFMVLKQMRYAGDDPSDITRGKFGAGAHTDWGSFTILATDATPGLQIQMNNQEWLPVPPKPDCLIINSGDQIAQLTNDVYRSAVHRVVIPPSSSAAKPSARFSTAVFTYFGVDAAVAPLPWTAVTEDENPARRHPCGRTTTREYFHHKLRESMGAGGGYSSRTDI